MKFVLLFRQIKNTVLLQIAITLLNLLSVVLLYKVFGTYTRGQMVIYNNAIAIATAIGGLSMGSTIVWAIASGIGSAKQIAFVCIKWLLYLLPIIAFVIVGLLYTNHTLWYIPFADNNTFLMLTIVFFLHIVASIFNAWLASFFAAKEKFLTPLVIQLIYLIVFVLWLFVLQNQSINHSAWVQKTICVMAGLYILSVAFLLFFSTKLFEGQQPISTNLNSILWKYTRLSFVCNVIQMLCYRLDAWFLQEYHTAKEVGIYAVAVLIIQMLWLFPNQVTNVLFTKFSKNGDAEIAIANKAVSFLFYTCLFVFGLAWISSYLIIPFLFGKECLPAANLLGILCLGAIPIGSTVVISTFFASQHLQIINLKGSLLGLAVCLILYSVLIPTYSYYGAAWGSVAGYVTNCIYLYFQYCKKYKVSVLSLFSLSIFNKKTIQSFKNGI